MFTIKAHLETAVRQYDANSTDAVAKYGPIAGWNVSAITDMSHLFFSLNNFNADISSWDTSRVTSMSYMFSDAFAFNQPLRMVVAGTALHDSSAFSETESRMGMPFQY